MDTRVVASHGATQCGPLKQSNPGCIASVQVGLQQLVSKKRKDLITEYFFHSISIQSFVPSKKIRMSLPQ
jgi:hypothetical protein